MKFKFHRDKKRMFNSYTYESRRLQRDQSTAFEAIAMKTLFHIESAGGVGFLALHRVTQSKQHGEAFSTLPQQHKHTNAPGKKNYALGTPHTHAHTAVNNISSKKTCKQETNSVKSAASFAHFSKTVA